MTVTVAAIRGMNPHAFADTAGDLRKASTKLGGECETYQNKVEHPLAAGHGWLGGGQPDAEIVATVNALAFGTSSMRLRASGNVLTGLSHAMTKAQQRLTDAEREAERAGLSLDDDGVVREPATSAAPVGPRGGRAGTPASGDVDRLQRKVDGIVLFASAADALARKALASYTKPLITTQTADRGLLKQAREDNGAAAGDLLGSINLEARLSKAEPRSLPPGHTLQSILETARRYFVAYAPAALDSLAMFAGTWLEAEGLADLLAGTTGGVLTAAETAGIGALVGAGVDLLGIGAVYAGQGMAAWGDQRLAGDLAMARAETRGTESSGDTPRRGEITCDDGVNRVYEPNSGKRGSERRGRVSPEPTDPLEALKNSIRVKPTSDARVAVDPKNGEYVVLRRENHEEPPVYHGYSLPWKGGTHNDALPQDMKNALIKAGLVDSKGRILGR